MSVYLDKKVMSLFTDIVLLSIKSTAMKKLLDEFNTTTRGMDRKLLFLDMVDLLNNKVDN